MRAGWALGKMGSRDRIPPAPARLLPSVIDQLWERLQKEQVGTVARMIVYALGEFCDQRGKDPHIVVPSEIARDMSVKLASYERTLKADLTREEPNLKGTIHLAINMMSGEPLAFAQERILLSLRSKLEDHGDDD